MATLTRQLGLATATAVVVGEVIAVGIFLTPAGMAKSLASPALLLAVWLIMGGIALCGALCYGELASRFPEAGGGYVYLREAYGSRVAFLYGWKCLLVMDPGVTAALGVGFAGYLQYLFGFPDWARPIAAVAAILAPAGINILGVRIGAGFTRWLTILKLGALAGIALWGFGLGRGDWSHFVPFAARPEGSEPLVAALAGGLVGAFYAFGGWWDASKLAGEVRDPAKTLPRALALGVLAITTVYVVTSAVFLYLVPVAEVTSGETFAAQAGEKLFGHVGGTLFSVIVIISVLGSLTALLMAAPRVYYAMAKDGVFPASVSAVHPRFGTPARAIAIQAVLASLLALSGTFDQIVGYFVFVTIAFIALTVGSVYVFRRRGGPRPAYAAFGYPITPAIFIVQIVALMVLLAVSRPLQAVLGTVVVLLGLVVYRFIRTQV